MDRIIKIEDGIDTIDDPMVGETDDVPRKRMGRPKG